MMCEIWRFNVSNMLDVGHEDAAGMENLQNKLEDVDLSLVVEGISVTLGDINCKHIHYQKYNQSSN